MHRIFENSDVDLYYQSRGKFSFRCTFHDLEGKIAFSLPFYALKRISKVSHIKFSQKIEFFQTLSSNMSAKMFTVWFIYPLCGKDIPELLCSAISCL